MQKAFEEKYNMPMLNVITSEVEQFRLDSVTNFFSQVTEYAKEAKMRNTVCLLHDSWWFAKALAALSTVDEVGVDPYWDEECEDIYSYVYKKSKEFMEWYTRIRKLIEWS